MTVENPPEVPDAVLAFLQRHSTMTVATTGSAGMPHAASMVYVNDGPVLYFCTRPDSATATHIAQNPAVAFTIEEPSADWRQMKGIQGQGEAYVVLSAANVTEVTGRFQRKFPSLTDLRTRNLSIFRITPTSLQYIDIGRAGAQGIQSLAADWHRTMVFNVFHELPPRQTEDIMGTLDTVRAEPGQVIVRQGAPADKFFIIADGEVEVVREDGGQTRRIATLSTGQFFGEMAVLRDHPRAATVRALAPTTLLAMPGEVLRDLVAQSFTTASDFEQLMQRRLAELNQSPEA